MYVCMYVCMYVFVYIHIYIYIFLGAPPISLRLTLASQACRALTTRTLRPQADVLTGDKSGPIDRSFIS